MASNYRPSPVPVRAYFDALDEHERTTYAQYNYSSAPVDVIDSYAREREGELASLARDCRDHYASADPLVGWDYPSLATRWNETAREHDSRALDRSED